MAAVAADALAVGRVSIWRYLDDRRAIRCDFLYQPGYPGVSDGAILQLRELPVYARMLGLRRVVTVNDVRDDPLGDEFRESYCEPLGITGLAVVQQTIIMAGGFVEARSETGGGTTVGLGLPAIGAPRRPSAVTRRNRPGRSVTSSDPSGSGSTAHGWTSPRARTTRLRRR